MLVPSLSARMTALLILAKKFRKMAINYSALFHMKTIVSLKYFVTDSLWK